MRLLEFSIVLSLVDLTVGDGAAQRPLSGGGQSASNDPSAVSQDLDAYIESWMDQWHAPGLAVAIVDGDKTWAKGYGYAILNSTPVTPHTLFYTGSTTKSFTAAGLSLLVDNATASPKLTWQTPVSSILRDDFVLSDEWATAHVTIEDALSHRTGYPRHDLASARTARETVRLLRHLPMTAEPRAKHQYSNKMYAAMGYLIETVTGSWLGDFFRERLWEPMGMNETYFSLKDVEKSSLLLANEYFYDYTSKGFYQTPHEPSSGEEGAGSIISNVLDYAKYLRVMMNDGAPLSKDGHREVKTPRSFSSMSKPPFTGPVSYAFGWNHGIFEGEQAYFHSGQVTMFVSIMIMIPLKQLAVTVMSNTESYAPELIAYHILYEHFGVPVEKRQDLNAHRYKRNREAQQKYLESCGEHIYPSVPEPPLLPTLPISEHIGKYHDPGYGTLEVELYCPDSNAESRGSQGRSIEKCQLRVHGIAGVSFQYLNPTVYLEPKSGNYWVARAYFEVVAAREIETPFWCLRAAFKVGADARITDFGLDVRMEGNDGPLVWFARVDD
nr:penicillin-binding protein [Colletotrichum truncatum]KAF6786881.1 penicillin-binding protein [Colletotrichum truncatum]